MDTASHSSQKPCKCTFVCKPERGGTNDQSKEELVAPTTALVGHDQQVCLHGLSNSCNTSIHTTSTTRIACSQIIVYRLLLCSIVCIHVESLEHSKSMQHATTSNNVPPTRHSMTARQSSKVTCYDQVATEKQGHSIKSRHRLY